MSLHETMIRHGHQMFRWRSYLPLLIMGPLFIALKESVYLESLVGDTLEDAWVFICFILSLAGLALRIYTIGYVPAGTSGRNTKEQKANVLNTTGIYSIVRNPLYLGNFIIILGVLLSIKVWWLVIIGLFGFLIYMERIILAEEKFLSEKFGNSYDQWRMKTPVILPNFRLWQPPAMEFSWKAVMRREYPGLLAIGTAFFIIEFTTDIFFEGEQLWEWASEDFIWPVSYAVIIALCLTLRYLKKHTKVLKVEGR
ncbi:MAG: lipid A phosphate methyltransferase [Alphaproteobacteria bacterium PRO2]|nr:lipid A phosphate methyltransferase [Alphaproteobacteria bacterium PRO2]